jgi:hypothetical protein
MMFLNDPIARYRPRMVQGAFCGIEESKGRE